MLLLVLLADVDSRSIRHAPDIVVDLFYDACQGWLKRLLLSDEMSLRISHVEGFLLVVVVVAAIFLPDAQCSMFLYIACICSMVSDCGVCAVCRKYQKRAELQLASRGQKLLFIVVDLSPVTDIDASAVHFLMVTTRPTNRSVKYLLNFVTSAMMSVVTWNQNRC